MSKKGSIVKAILSKLIWIVLAFVVFFFIGDGMGIIPQSVKSSISWLGENFTALALLTCFLTVAFLINKGLSRKKQRFEE